MIQVWTINILIMRSRLRTEKSQNGQKHHWRKATKNKNQSGQNPQKRKYFNTPPIKVYYHISVHVITWYRCWQSTFSSCDHVCGQRKPEMDKSTIGEKPQKDKNQSGQNPKRGNILILQQSRCTVTFLFMWSHDTGVDNQHSCHAITWADREQAKWTKKNIGQKPQRIKIKADKTPKRGNILILQQSICTIPFLFMWSHDAGVDNQHSRHVITYADREKPKWTKAP